MNEELLKRLIEALEEINSNLSDISTSLNNLEQSLQDCTVQHGSRHFLCVASNFVNY